VRQLPPIKLLKNIVKRNINVQDVVVDRVFDSSDQAAQVVQLLSRAAVDLDESSLVLQLAQVEQIATHEPDTLKNVPEVLPVLKDKVGHYMHFDKR